MARKSGIFAEKLPEEVILYDKTKDRVHCLNRAAAIVWENSDGSKTVDDLTQVVAAQCAAPVDRKLVLQALEELEGAGLLEAANSAASGGRLPSRREAVSKMVMVGSALVATIVAAPPMAHASPRAPTDPPKLPIGPTPPHLPIGHHPRRPLPPGLPKRNEPPDPLPSHPMFGLNPTEPQPPDPLAGLNQAGPQPRPITELGLPSTQPSDLPNGLRRQQQKLDFLSYLLRPVRSVWTRSLRAARTFWRTGD